MSFLLIVTEDCQQLVAESNEGRISNERVGCIRGSQRFPIEPRNEMDEPQQVSMV